MSASDSVHRRVDALASLISRMKATHVTGMPLREQARHIVQDYFRQARPENIGLGVPETRLSSLDDAFQRLLRLSHSKQRKSSYRTLLQEIKDELVSLSGLRELHFGKAGSSKASINAVQAKIAETLEPFLPHAALSFRQALDDLSSSRISYRGTAAELRESLREVVDHFATDENVMSAPGFRLEQGRSKPTMPQKVRFILRTRKSSSSSIAAAEAIMSSIDEATALLARSVYTFGSAATHGSRGRAEVLNLQRYVETLLAHLLEVDS